jgi:hypothetical protein
LPLKKVIIVVYGCTGFEDEASLALRVWRLGHFGEINDVASWLRAELCHGRHWNGCAPSEKMISCTPTGKLGALGLIYCPVLV